MTQHSERMTALFARANAGWHDRGDRVRGSASTRETGAEQGKGKGRGAHKRRRRLSPEREGRQEHGRVHLGHTEAEIRPALLQVAQAAAAEDDADMMAEFKAAQEEAERQQMEEEYALEREIEGEPTPERPRALARRPPRLLCCLLPPL